MKACSLCNSSKPFESFYRKQDSKDGRASACIECRKVQKKEEYVADKARVLQRVAEYRAMNPEKVSEAKKASRLKKYDEYRAKQRQQYSQNKDAILLQMAEYRQANKELILDRQMKYRERNRRKLVDDAKVYYLKNKEKVDEYRRGYARERMKTDPLYALSRLVRRRILFALKNFGIEKRTRTSEMLGCTYADLKVHLEQQFAPGMSWVNRGDWHVDHIIPLASARTEYELLALCHYTNLQPLWAFDNLSKGARIRQEA
jgi:hypothetical protein